VIGRLHSRYRAIEFKQFLRTLDREVPDELAVHLVLGNSSTHKMPCGADAVDNAPAPLPGPPDDSGAGRSRHRCYAMACSVP
jgi:hypothetical protein